MVISLFLNDSAHNILNDVLKIIFIWSCWKLALQWFYVFDGFLVSVILSSVISLTGGMVMCFSSSQVSILHLQKDVPILLSFGCFFSRILSCFCCRFDLCFQHVISFYSSLFTNKTSVTGQQLHCGFWQICCSRFLEDLTSLPSDGFFCFKIILQSFIK